MHTGYFSLLNKTFSLLHCYWDLRRCFRFCQDYFIPCTVYRRYTPSEINVFCSLSWLDISFLTRVWSRLLPKPPRMSHHSTTLTSTATYTLLKYSRSYANTEWQHFVNPVIKLRLEVQKTPQGELTSFWLRILWLMSSGNEGTNSDQREISFVRLIASFPSPCFEIDWKCCINLTNSSN